MDTTLIESAGGIFDVHLDGTQVWSKFQRGRFPTEDEVLSGIKTLMGKG